MKFPHALAALGAAVLIPLTVAVPAHADESYTGVVTSADPIAAIIQPDPDTDACVKAVDPGNAVAHYDDVNYVSQSSGPRRFALQVPPGMGAVIYVYRNGTCVAAEYQPDSEAEALAGVVDVEGVNLAVGDQVRVQIAYLGDPATAMPWSLTIQQAGTANGPETGNAGKYAHLGYQVDCGAHTTTVAFTKKLAKKVDGVHWVKIKANGATVKTLKGRKLAKALKKARRGKPYVVAGVPSVATQLSVEIKLDNGKKKILARAYSAC
ncbi:hypothetical protein [Nocardioides daeguensis]|uniref:Uncharacterized protein n=1 Tax=Nocardioides daeguensis TaxID=908359 RepID=A0ABP6VRK0_9ACTN|nr:hypothetical protein [Nocardioides daeguensis]MBV6727568.1 hypothetical protein [Nocardioides daeguensis]MCR1773210.1 hypothetical protein [Nocardioides daeguensis]